MAATRRRSRGSIPVVRRLRLAIPCQISWSTTPCATRISTRVSGAGIEQQNFDTYDMMRIAQMPKVEAIVMPSGGFWGGVGEPTIAVAAPAVLNAITAATGKRYRTFPLKHHGLSLA